MHSHLLSPNHGSRYFTSNPSQLSWLVRLLSLWELQHLYSPFSARFEHRLSMDCVLSDKRPLNNENPSEIYSPQLQDETTNHRNYRCGNCTCRVRVHSGFDARKRYP